MIAVFCMQSCSKDDSSEDVDNTSTAVEKAKELLNGDVVLNTRATMNGVDKTHLENGCPTKFNFSWKDDGTVDIALNSFTVGAMPFAITFKCNAKLMTLNTWEKNEYTGEGWYKLKGVNGNVTTNSSDPEYSKPGSGSTIDGYINLNTRQIMFIINYNLMNVRTETFMQTIDKSRINNFDAEFKQYEQDLLQWKKDHGEA